MTPIGPTRPLTYGAKLTPSPTPTNTPAPPQGKPVVGAIRWDAWFGDLSRVGTSVESTLSPKHWHHRLPFYATEVSDDEVLARANSQQVMDKEIAYASAAGLDYWAYVIYPLDNPLSLGLKLYLSSEHRSNINFCLNLQGGWLGDHRGLVVG